MPSARTGGDRRPKAVPIERTEAKAAAVPGCSLEATLSIARATKCTLQVPMPILITKALTVISASPGSDAVADSVASPVVAMTGPKEGRRPRLAKRHGADHQRLSPRTADPHHLARHLYHLLASRYREPAQPKVPSANTLAPSV